MPSNWEQYDYNLVSHVLPFILICRGVRNEKCYFNQIVIDFGNATKNCFI